MKRTKRKYTRKVLPDALQSTRKPIKEESSIILPLEVLAADYNGDVDVIFDGKMIAKAFAFNDLPLSTRTQVENTIKMRKRLGLSDDSEERRVFAVRYFRGDRPR